MVSLETLFQKLPTSAFRSRFFLPARERQYLREKGLTIIADHASTFIDTRLAPAEPVNDGKQTPFRGHPVFIAQHATACCCRSCLDKWHGITKGHVLTTEERRHIVACITRWLDEQTKKEPI